MVMACTLLSRLAGWVKMALIAAFFGGGGPADVINLVFGVPNSLRKLFAEGAFSSAFIPVLATSTAEDPSEAAALRLVRSLSAFLIVVLGSLSVVSLLAPDVMLVLLARFRDPTKLPLARVLFRWEFNYIVFVSLSALVQAVLNTHGRFTVAALSPLVFSAAVILGLIFLRGPLGPVVMGVGVFVGGVLQLAVQLPSLLRLRYSLWPSFRFRDPAFRKTIALWLPYLASASLFVITQLVAQRFASGIADGAVTAVSNAVTVMNLPFGIFTVSVLTVLFPRLSAQAARADTAGLHETVGHGFEFILALLVPSSVALALYGREVIAVAFQRVQFLEENTRFTYPVLVAYAVGLVPLSLFQFLQRLFFSLKDFRTTIASAVAVALVDIGLSLWLKETPLRTTGLAVANSVAFTVGFVWLAVAARRRLGPLGAARILAGAGKAVAASLPLTGILVGARALWPDLWRAGGTIVNAGRVVGILGVGALATLAMFALLRMSFLAELLRSRRKT
jgi:putative peptidoglycan lipid II flippase